MYPQQDKNKMPVQPATQFVPPPGYEPQTTRGPGCLVWGLVTLFSLGLAGVIVLLAALLGWSEGLQVAKLNATSTRVADINVQCQRIGIELVEGNTSLVQRRLEDLLPVTPGVPCLSAYIPTATAVYLQSLPTDTPPPTQTPLPTATNPPSATPTVQVMPSVAPTSDVVAPSTNPDSPFDLDALLTEAQQQIAGEQIGDAIDTLEAIRDVDPNYQRATVETLLFNTLTREATRLFRTGENRAQAILYTNRAEALGEIGELNYERYVAQLYVDAQSNLNTNNYTSAIPLLREIVVTQGLTNYGNARQLLFDAYMDYGNAYELGNEPCPAVTQYQAALSLQPGNPTALNKRNTAQTACSGGAQPTAPGAAPGVPQPTTPPIAPIGVPGT